MFKKPYDTNKILDTLSLAADVFELVGRDRRYLYLFLTALENEYNKGAPWGVCDEGEIIGKAVQQLSELINRAKE